MVDVKCFQTESSQLVAYRTNMPTGTANYDAFNLFPDWHVENIYCDYIEDYLSGNSEAQFTLWTISS
jgi:hypothetical protein